MFRTLTFLALFLCVAIPAHASESCIKPASIINLQNADEKRLKLARSLKAYLKKQGRDERLATSIYKASLKTGVDFELMVLKAKMESDLGRLTVAANSSARGVFQYIEQTWLTLIRRYGDKIGYPHYADAIARPKYPGVPKVKNNNAFLKAEILSLRHDADMAALLKAYQVREETDVIRSLKKGKRVTATDHYIVHMLGLPLAKEFYAMKRSGSVLAVARLNNPAMREAAKLNRVFFFKGKRPLTAREAYAKFENRVNEEFKTIQTVAYKKEIQNCANIKEEPPQNTLQSLKPLCRNFHEDILQPVSINSRLTQFHPCTKLKERNS